MTSRTGRSTARIVRSLHEWVGLLVFVGVLLVGASGAAIVFLGDLFEIQYGEIVRVSDEDRQHPSAGPVAMVESAREYEGAAFRPQGLLMPHSRMALDVALVYGPIAGQEREDPRMVAVNPHTGEAQGSFWLDRAFGHELVHFHENLLAGPVGEWVVLALGIAIALFALSGLYLWWPRREKVAAKLARTTWRKPRATAFALHGLIGFWLAPLLIYYAVTGVAISRPDWFGPMLASPYSRAPAPAGEYDHQGPEAALDEAVAAGQAAFPERRLTGFYIDDGLIGLTFKSPDDLNAFQGDAFAWVDLKDGTLLQSIVTTRQSVPMALGGGMHSLHSGLTFGWAGLSVTVLSGLGLVALSILGLVRWWQRWRPRIAAGARPSARSGLEKNRALPADRS